MHIIYQLWILASMKLYPKLVLMLSSSNIVSQIPSIKNPDAPSMLDRLLRLLASYKILTCSIPHQDGDSKRQYGVHGSPFCKILFLKDNMVFIFRFYF